LQVDAQEYLSLCEQTNKICFFDIESTNLKGDYGTILVVSIKPYGKKPKSFTVDTIGKDKKVVKAVIEEMSQYQIWTSFYGKMFDVPMINTRALVHGLNPLPKRPHLDIYFMLRQQLNPSRRSQAHYLRWLSCEEQKMDMSPSDWAEIVSRGTTHMKQRCESDVKGLEALYDRTKHLIINISK
jgi:hypothetical protein